MSAWSKSKLCPCCGNESLTIIKEVGRGKNDAVKRCQVCGAIVTARFDPCPKCRRPYYDIDVNDTHVFYVHRKEVLPDGTFVNIGCDVPTPTMPGFTTAREVLKERCGV